MNSRTLFPAILMSCAIVVPAAENQERAPIGGFTSVRLAQAPTIDGKIDPGEWDRAFTDAGFMTPFEHQLQTAETVVSVGHDSRNLYFLFRCKRGNVEWRLLKSVRENDDYSFGDPSVEVWVSPPKMVPETYQSVINTFPAVMDNHQIPTRGYTAMGWKGSWVLGVDENDTDYVIEAAIPVSDFGMGDISNGDIWKLLLCRTVHGAKPRAQASWSLTQGFSEIPQHPDVLLVDDGVVVQVQGVTSLFTGSYAIPLSLAAPSARSCQLEVEVRRHRAPTPGGADDVVEIQKLDLAAGARKDLSLVGTEAGDDKQRAHLTLVVREVGLERPVYRKTIPYTVNGWTPAAPQRPEQEALPPELAFQAMYGPETRSIMVKADIFDLPTKAQARSGRVRVLDPASGSIIAELPLSPFRYDYASAYLTLPKDLDIPVIDFAANNKARDQQMAAWRAEQKAKEEREPITDEKILKERDRIAKGLVPPPTNPPGWPKPPKPDLPQVAPKTVKIEVAITDAGGSVLKTAERELQLVRYQAEWMDNAVGITDKVIPPWTPIVHKDGALSVWNRTYGLDGLGLVRSLDNGGTAQISAMRLIAQIDGKETIIDGGAFTVDRLVEAEADFKGAASVAGLSLRSTSRLEFDGFVRNTWTLAPAGAEAARIDRLTLEVVLPEEEATHFCVTSGGWAAIHDATPERWDSRSTANGMLIGDWIPYIWLTNGDRAFQWFADSDRGWIHDPDKALPTQEIVRAGGNVTLRVHFVEIPAAISEPRSFTWGWQTFPSRPLPDGFRAQVCANNVDTPNVKSSFFWTDADWAVLWPYYCSPYAWSFAKSKWFFDRLPPEGRHHPLVGSIAHSIGRYRDYEGNEFPALAADWGATPGQIGNSDVTASKGPNDFRLWHYRRWVRESGLRGIYVDENYLAIEENFLTGNAWFTPEGRLQRGYNYLGLREYFKRLRVMFHQEGVTSPNLWQHISSGAAYNAWFGDVLMEGENVEPTNEIFDYLEVLPAGRLRAIGSPMTAGGMMMMMCQSARHPTAWADKHIHQFTGWVLAHDITPEQVGMYPYLVEAGKLYEKDVRFLPYWKSTTPVKTSTPDCLVSAHRASDRAIAWVVNLAREDRKVDIAIDWKGLGLDPERCLIIDAEHGRPIPATAGGIAVAVAKRDYVPVLIVERGALRGFQTWSASFDAGTKAETALGVAEAMPLNRKGGTLSLVEGRQGKALATGDGVRVSSWLHLNDEAGRVSFDARVAEGAKGHIASIGLAEISLRQDPSDKKRMQVALALRKDAKDKEPITATMDAPGAGWHRFVVTWKLGKLSLSIDDHVGGEVPMTTLGFALTMKHPKDGYDPALCAALVFGSKGGAIDALDSLILDGSAE